MRLLSVLIIGWVSLRASRSDACSRLAASGVAFSVLPADGTQAPTNALVWVVGSGEVTVAVDGKPVATTARRVNVSAESTDVLQVMTPTEPFPMGALVEVSMGTQRLSDFRVSSTTDREAPPQPVARAEKVVAGFFGASSCGTPSSVNVATDAPADLLFLVGDGAAAALPETSLGVGSGQQAVAIAPPEGPLRMRLLAVDFAGNVSPPSDVVSVEVPRTAQGCAAVPGTSLAAAAALLLALRRAPRAG